MEGLESCLQSLTNKIVLVREYFLERRTHITNLTKLKNLTLHTRALNQNLLSQRTQLEQLSVRGQEPFFVSGETISHLTELRVLKAHLPIKDLTVLSSLQKLEYIPNLKTIHIIEAGNEKKIKKQISKKYRNFDVIGPNLDSKFLNIEEINK